MHASHDLIRIHAIRSCIHSLLCEVVRVRVRLSMCVCMLYLKCQVIATAVAIVVDEILFICINTTVMITKRDHHGYMFVCVWACLCCRRANIRDKI